MDNDFAKQLTDAVDNRKGDVADAIGMPDEKDRATLINIIRKYEKKHPGEIEQAVRLGRHDFHTGAHKRNLLWHGEAVVNKDSRMVYALELPEGLYNAIEKVFPSMFKSKKHLRWFRKNFHKLTISGKKIK